jgi:hypothetical protein
LELNRYLCENESILLKVFKKNYGFIAIGYYLSLTLTFTKVWERWRWILKKANQNPKKNICQIKFSANAPVKKK